VQAPMPWMFFLKVGVHTPQEPDKHPDEKAHQYVMTVNTLQDRCPRSVRFDTMPHEDEIIDDHPGHANAD
jgi:hypothetical protein